MDVIPDSTTTTLFIMENAMYPHLGQLKANDDSSEEFHKKLAL